MEEILKQTYSGVINLREYAGCAGSRACKKPEAKMISLYTVPDLGLYYAKRVTQTA
jgi:hypothetical protein